MKTTRDQLKAVVKELLVEILGESLGTLPVRASPGRNPSVPIAGLTTEQGRATSRKKPGFDPRLDTPVGSRMPTDALKEAVMRNAGGNAVLADILADTAMTTLPTQMGHEPPTRERSGGSRIVQQEQFHGDPAEVFGEGGQMRVDGSSHWADLAFSSSGKKSA